MKLSVICPIYNEEKYIVPFLDSVLQQDFSHDDMEVLLVDGMSRDRTRQVISQYIAKYPLRFVFLTIRSARLHVR